MARRPLLVLLLAAAVLYAGKVSKRAGYLGGVVAA